MADARSDKAMNPMADGQKHEQLHVAICAAPRMFPGPGLVWTGAGEAINVIMVGVGRQGFHFRIGKRDVQGIA